MNLVECGATATAEILSRYLPVWGFPITSEVATALLTGIVVDTIGFRTGNMTSQALRIAADLMDDGANLPEIYRCTLLQRSFEAARYWGTGLTHLQRQDGLVWATLTKEDRRAVGYPGRDDADLINLVSSINNAMVALVFVEQNNGNVKVSWRYQPGLDVYQVALKFGGGGHEAAAGAELKGTLKEVEEIVIQATKAIVRDI